MKTTVTLTIDAETKEEATKIFMGEGKKMSAVINNYLKQIVLGEKNLRKINSGERTNENSNSYN